MSDVLGHRIEGVDGIVKLDENSVFAVGDLLREVKSGIFNMSEGIRGRISDVSTALLLLGSLSLSACGGLGIEVEKDDAAPGSTLENPDAGEDDGGGIFGSFFEVEEDENEDCNIGDKNCDEVEIGFGDIKLGWDVEDEESKGKPVFSGKGPDGKVYECFHDDVEDGTLVCENVKEEKTKVRARVRAVVRPKAADVKKDARVKDFAGKAVKFEDVKKKDKKAKKDKVCRPRDKDRVCSGFR